MREYNTGEFTIKFNGDLVSVDVDWEQLTNYIVTKYRPIKHYVHDDETFFTLDMTQFDMDEICEDMDEFSLIANMSDDDLTNKINGYLSIASTAVRKNVHDYLGQTKRNVPDASTVERPDVQKEQPDASKPGTSAGSNSSIF